MKFRSKVALAGVLGLCVMAGAANAQHSAGCSLNNGSEVAFLAEGVVFQEHKCVRDDATGKLKLVDVTDPAHEGIPVRLSQDQIDALSAKLTSIDATNKQILMTLEQLRMHIVWAQYRDSSSPALR